MCGHETTWCVQMSKTYEKSGETPIFTNLFVYRGAEGTAPLAATFQEKVQRASGPRPGDISSLFRGLSIMSRLELPLSLGLLIYQRIRLAAVLNIDLSIAMLYQ